jgi:2'-5' RNA ligase
LNFTGLWTRQFDFLGKDSIRYFNTVEVEEKVYKAIGQFKKGLFGSGPCRTYTSANLLHICLTFLDK